MNVKEAIRKRGLIKSKLTRFGTFFNAFQKGEKQNTTELKLRLDKLESLIDEFDVIQTYIEAEDDSSEQQEERVNFENEFFSIQAAAVDELALYDHSSTAHQSFRNDRPEIGVQLKLPKIRLPEFSGEYENWQCFRDNFTVMIHNTKIPEIQKLQYLRLSLRGTAAQLIENLEVTERNYLVAWNLVHERFENKRLIVQTHVSKLFNVSKLEKESASELRSFFDLFTRHINALKAIGEPTDSWSTLLVYLATSKLDNKSLMEWEMSRKDTSVPTWIEFNIFLNHRCQTLAAIDVSKSQGRSVGHTSAVLNRKSFTTVQSHATTTESKCYVCKLSHALYQCPQFLGLRTPDKVKIARAANVCVNCLRNGHRASACRSTGCHICNKRHNSKLHLNDDEKEEAFANNVLVDTMEKEGSTNQENIINEDESQLNLKAQVNDNKCQGREITVLSTALVTINDIRGNENVVRVLLDSGSQANLMTSRLAMKLGFPVMKTSITITGVSGISCQPIGQVSAVVNSRISAYTVNLNFLVLQNIASTLPSIKLNEEISKVMKTFECADPDISSTRQIDMILGSEIFFELLCIGQVKPMGTRAIWQKTVFGWVLSGCVNVEESKQNSACMTMIADYTDTLQSQLKQFWELEEIVRPHPSRKGNNEEIKCETHFTKTCAREINGRFVLKLPFRENVNQLGESRSIAEKRFYNIERRLKANSELKDAYVKFMQEYQDLGHMVLKGDTTIHSINNPQVYLPHHAVIRTESSTTRIRVVFDASTKTSTSISLNDTLMIGPNIQDDLRGILMRFRTHQVAITADIEKMYRQIGVSKDCQSYQQILWRENPDKPLETYQLCTVTYGTSAAPFMAIRTLHHLADCEKENFSRASYITKRDFYVDDLITGARNINEAVKLQDEMLQLCKKGCLILRKWCSNHNEILDRVPNEMRATSHDLNFHEDNSTKTLGVRWRPKEDQLHYIIQLTEPLSKITKRIVVSEMSRLFDPLGLVGPVIVKAKIFVQQLWKLKLAWDESLPMQYHTAWVQYRSELHNITNINIPRRVIFSDEIRTQELHIFCDASQVAYGACAYIRSISEAGKITSNLLIAKSRVCPLKSMTIPRLELCAALLGSKLMIIIMNALQDTIKPDRIILWTDSLIVLSWIRSEKTTDTWKTFVANRTEEIRELTSKQSWRHIEGVENPADLLSRGLKADELVNCNQWWTGPTWITKPESEWPTESNLIAREHLPEQRKEIIILTVQFKCDNDFAEIINKFSKLVRLQRVTAYLFRGITPSKLRVKGELNVHEIQRAFMFWIKITQATEYTNEIEQLKKGTQLHNSRLQLLVPFIDSENILRVGGRLQNSLEPQDACHPILLPSTAYLVHLIVDHEHRRLIHAGPQQLISSLHRNFWIPGLRNVIKKVIFRCNPCYRWKIQASRQLMGALPISRVTPSSVFNISGVDYAGPFQVRHGSVRSKHIYKSYIAIFVCFATRAIHLEWVDDLTTESFIAALRIFIARRGCPQQIYSDNGRNFVGAAAQLKLFLASLTLKQNVSIYAAQTGINWSFIPPHSPHMGGLWEAGVKSMKFHLRRSLGESILNYQEAKTVLAQIEAVLNSRPLTPISNHPCDMEALTPGHFIIGKPLTSFPEPNYLHVKCPRLRWHMVQQLVQVFWHRWRMEYLQSLQVRHKWSQSEPNIKIGDLVLIKEDYETPLSWSMGRIVLLHKGSDGLARVATIKTATTEVKRPIHKLCLLPSQEDNKLNPQEV